ncbi:MAG: sensor histidine kinase [Pseudomonadota bacterium]
MVFHGSLRRRLAVLILVPLIFVSGVAVYWRYDNARQTAEDIFDRNLIMLCLAVSRDVAFSGGDSLSLTTANLFRDISGGTVFYHVYGPDGSFVTGYSSPPIRRAGPALTNNTPLLFDATYQGRPVRAVSLAERVDVDGIVGRSVVTVWQSLGPRTAFANRLALQAGILAAALFVTVALLVGLGIRRGLRPLNDLEDAIRKRSTTDLSPIERAIPIEAHGIVSRLNDLFSQLTVAKTVQDRMVSNAAHQLRNPVAGLHVLAQSIQSAPTWTDAQNRSATLVQETRATMRLTEQMLSFERIKGGQTLHHPYDINKIVSDIATRIAPDVLRADVDVQLSLAPHPVIIDCDRTMLGEAVLNLAQNALQHGGKTLQFMRLSTHLDRGMACICVENDGRSFSGPIDQAFERFTQGRESQGAGLGLAIVAEIAKQHHGTARLAASDVTKVCIDLPITRQSTDIKASS